MRETIFKDWHISGYVATSPDGKHRLWVANGFTSFYDDSCHAPMEAILVGIGFWERLRLWKELKREMRNRLNLKCQKKNP